MNKDVIVAVVNNAEVIVKAINKLDLKKYAGLVAGASIFVICKDHGDKVLDTFGKIADKLIDVTESFELDPEKLKFAFKRRKDPLVVDASSLNNTEHDPIYNYA